MENEERKEKLENKEEIEEVKEIEKDNVKKDHTMIIMVSILGGLLLVAIIVVIIMSSIGSNANSNGNSSCGDGGTCSLGLRLIIDYFKSIL